MTDVVASRSSGVFERGKSQHLEQEDSVGKNSRPFAGLNPHLVIQPRAAEAFLFFFFFFFVGETVQQQKLHVHQN